MSRTCKAKYCRNEAYTNPKGYTRPYCSRCKSRRYRESNPYNYFYRLLKSSAKRRGIDFELTLEEFSDLWKRNPEKWKDKLSGVHGMSGETWTVDRIRPWEGYHADNVQILSLYRNVMKWYKHGKFKLEVYWSNPKPQNEEAPF